MPPESGMGSWEGPARLTISIARNGARRRFQDVRKLGHVDRPSCPGNATGNAFTAADDPYVGRPSDEARGEASTRPLRPHRPWQADRPL
jgi:hypothetical protein